MISLIKKFLYYSGIVRLFLSRYKNTIPIIMIHGVMDYDKHAGMRPLWRRHSTQEFEAFIRELSHRYTFISMDDLNDALHQRKPIAPYSMVLTFDDGYRNNLIDALPILKKYNAPACFYVTGATIESGDLYWIDLLDVVIQSNSALDEVCIGPVKQSINRKSRASLEQSFNDLCQALKSTYNDDVQMLSDIKQFADAQLSDGQEYQKIKEANQSWLNILRQQDFKNLDNSITIGSHTNKHYRLDKVEPYIAEQELKESKQFVENLTGKACQHFCFPNGNHNPSVVTQVKAAGYVSAVTVNAGTNQPTSNSFLLNRIPMPYTTNKSDIYYYLLRVMANTKG